MSIRYLYIINFKTQNIFKVGITNNLNKRVIALVREWGEADLANSYFSKMDDNLATKIEKGLHGLLNEYEIKHLEGSGKTEFFHTIGLPIALTHFEYFKKSTANVKSLSKGIKLDNPDKPLTSTIQKPKAAPASSLKRQPIEKPLWDLDKGRLALNNLLLKQSNQVPDWLIIKPFKRWQPGEPWFEGIPGISGEDYSKVVVSSLILNNYLFRYEDRGPYWSPAIFNLCGLDVRFLKSTTKTKSLKKPELLVASFAASSSLKHKLMGIINRYVCWIRG